MCKRPTIRDDPFYIGGVLCTGEVFSRTGLVFEQELLFSFSELAVQFERELFNLNVYFDLSV